MLEFYVSGIYVERNIPRVTEISSNSQLRRSQVGFMEDLWQFYNVLEIFFLKANIKPDNFQSLI